MTFSEQADSLIQQLKSEGIEDNRVLDAILKTPRERFLPESLHPLAYENRALPIGNEQTISQPSIVAMMTESLQLRGNETVLEIGTGSGYQSAILAQLCGKVVTVERIKDLASSAKQLLTELGYENIEYHFGDGALGWEGQAPYSAIIVTASAAERPQKLVSQLEDGGRMVIPVGTDPVQILYRLKRCGERIKEEELCRCRFVPLITEETNNGRPQ
ncbi:Protein-L-isoaspartate O-methyltransferase [Polystyrenella longa]|uniref:Protein-L-isoaspartate O-methyltransferase n=1 Tax=Polystyrenella longa TaxID=2528007 RepID=A0A518CQK5_9PLAN|nr:protein-L-isoaspartate(D-aspartate) O-methyltransferase [Polystyrenella longa]QDU81509.1 Protein-L-isoaspartate O-methyltransferase [Polystyrenella longa]